MHFDNVVFLAVDSYADFFSYALPALTIVKQRLGTRVADYLVLGKTIPAAGTTSGSVLSIAVFSTWVVEVLQQGSSG